MLKLKGILIAILTVTATVASAQIKVRLFSNQSPESVVFSVGNGSYKLNTFNGEDLFLGKGEPVIITRLNGKLAVKTRNSKGLFCDSLYIKGVTGDDSFSLRRNGDSPLRQFYEGDLNCFPDLETLVLINICDVEKYVAGVVQAEGGNGKNAEYFKSQAVIARTYLYKYLDKHLTDGYNVCDNTHCQAYNGLSTDSAIIRSAGETKGLVIVDKDSSLIISAFSSNCGGETASAHDVWLTSQPYLMGTIDPYCINSRNSVWEKNISSGQWLQYLKKSGYKGNGDNKEAFRFLQKNRVTEYKVDSFSIPLNVMRTELDLRSAFFSVIPSNDSIHLSGKGYGHGVGLCQEGAMEMAARGMNYGKIIDFYYFGVLIMNINLVPLTGYRPVKTSVKP